MVVCQDRLGAKAEKENSECERFAQAEPPEDQTWVRIPMWKENW
eukprot:COSAG06_NODE_69140_length_198_cov_50.666667_1_plen_43_part_01